MDKFGSRITPAGKMAKACQDSRRIVIAQPGDLGIKDTMPIMLRVPQSSTKPLRRICGVPEAAPLPAERVHHAHFVRPERGVPQAQVRLRRAGHGPAVPARCVPLDGRSDDPHPRSADGGRRRRSERGGRHAGAVAGAGSAGPAGGSDADVAASGAGSSWVSPRRLRSRPTSPSPRRSPLLRRRWPSRSRTRWRRSGHGRRRRQQLSSRRLSMRHRSRLLRLLGRWHLLRLRPWSSRTSRAAPEAPAVCLRRVGTARCRRSSCKPPRRRLECTAAIDRARPRGLVGPQGGVASVDDTNAPGLPEAQAERQRARAGHRRDGQSAPAAAGGASAEEAQASGRGSTRPG